MRMKYLVTALTVVSLFLFQAVTRAAPPGDDTVDTGKKKTTKVDVEAWKERIAKMEEAKALLRRILKGFPANCVTAEVVGTPKPVKVEDKKVTFRVQIRLGVDEKAMASFRKRLLLVLDEFKDNSWDESWSFDHLARSEVAKKGPARADSEFARTKKQEESKATTDGVTVYVNTERDEEWKSLKWKAFALDQMLTGVFNDSTGRHGQCVISMVSKAGDTIPLDRFALDDERLGGATPIADRSEYGNGGRTFFISSTFLRDDACSKHAPTVTIVREIELSGDQLDHLEAFRCEMRFVGSDKEEK